MEVLCLLPPSLCVNSENKKSLLQRGGQFSWPTQLNVAAARRRVLFCDGREILSGRMGAPWVMSTGESLDHYVCWLQGHSESVSGPICSHHRHLAISKGDTLSCIFLFVFQIYVSTHEYMHADIQLHSTIMNCNHECITVYTCVSTPLPLTQLLERHSLLLWWLLCWSIND